MILFAILLSMQATAAPEAESEEKRKVSMKFDVDAEFINTHDKDGDGALDFKEFEAAMIKRMQNALAPYPEAQAQLTPEKVAKWSEGALGPAFRVLDKNSDQRIAPADLPKKDDVN